MPWMQRYYFAFGYSYLIVDTVKVYLLSWMWWNTLETPTLGKVEAGELGVQNSTWLL